MKFRACEELLFEQAICSTSHLRKINEQSNCLWDTTTQYSHLLGQFRDSLRLLKMMIFINFFVVSGSLIQSKMMFFAVLEPQGHPQSDSGSI